VGKLTVVFVFDVVVLVNGTDMLVFCLLLGIAEVSFGGTVVL
jgi:hypothetical protein